MHVSVSLSDKTIFGVMFFGSISKKTDLAFCNFGVIQFFRPVVRLVMTS